MIKIAPFEALYSRKCQTHISWEKIEDRVSLGLELLDEMDEQVKILKQRLAEANDR